MAIYGKDGPFPRATLHFDLAEPPGERMVLSLTGLGDEWGTQFAFGIEVNGVSFPETLPAFPNWNQNQDGARGENARWGQVQVVIPADVFRIGKNEIAAVSRQPGANSGEPPYMLLAEATLAPESDAAAAVGASLLRFDNVRLDDKGNLRSGPSDSSGPSPNQGNSGKGSGEDEDEDKDKKKDE